MSALTVTLGADITALKRSMASATQLVSASAKKMASLTAAGLKIGLGAALAGGGVARGAAHGRRGPAPRVRGEESVARVGSGIRLTSRLYGVYSVLGRDGDSASSTR